MNQHLASVCTDASSATWILVKVNVPVMGDFAAVATEAMLLGQLRLKGRNAYLDLSAVVGMSSFAMAKLSLFKKLLSRQGFDFTVVHPGEGIAGMLRFSGLGELLSSQDRDALPLAALA